MKHFISVISAMLLAGEAVKAQQTILAPWNHTWAVMHPMGAMPDGPAGPDPDFDTTWYLPAAEFGLQYNGPLFGGAQSGVSGAVERDRRDAGNDRGDYARDLRRLRARVSF